MRNGRRRNYKIAEQQDCHAGGAWGTPLCLSVPGDWGIFLYLERLARGPAADRGVCPTFFYSEPELYF